MNVRACAATMALLLIAGCGSDGGIRLWPFGEGGAIEVARKPANSTEYACEGNRRFYVRSIDGGALWLIAPDREIRLDKLPGEGRYGVGRVLLETSGPAATLTDPPAAQFTGCKKAA